MSNEDFEKKEYPIHDHSEAILNDFSDDHRARVENLNTINVGIFSPIIMSEFGSVLK